MSYNDVMLNIIIFLITISIIPIFIYEFQIRDPSLFFIPKITLTIISLGIIIWYFYDYNKDEDDYNINPYEDNIYFNSKNKYKSFNNTPYCRRTDVDTYEKISKLYTQKKLKELYESNRFKQMKDEKGENLSNWNWQSRDRKRGKKQLDESDINSYDIENMTVTNS